MKHCITFHWLKRPNLFLQVYTVNTKQSIREAYFRRLKSHVPAMSTKENPTKLEVILEAISYIQRLKKDLENGQENSSSFNSSNLENEIANIENIAKNFTNVETSSNVHEKKITKS